ncbi:hypothetical protein [Kingella potus]|uniref:hypothetical protein n=1 Tax=Kingella potus TaxID=265175 RepID=UPI001FD1BE68|nr:hypothetical protein [Kingella potus]UOP01610.1 hypothetical protein LVJ84_05450 [Kingella potus]
MLFKEFFQAASAFVPSSACGEGEGGFCRSAGAKERVRRFGGTPYSNGQIAACRTEAR